MFYSYYNANGNETECINGIEQYLHNKIRIKESHTAFWLAWLFHMVNGCVCCVVCDG